MDEGSRIYVAMCLAFLVPHLIGVSMDRVLCQFAEWFDDHVTLPVWPCVLYLICIVVGCNVMKAREPFDLRGCLASWSFALAAFSAYGALITVPALARLVEVHGLDQSICRDAELYLADADTKVWIYLFTFSKLPELIDTAFIVLRKKPLIFLHWYHHFTVLLYGWHSQIEHPSTALWFAAMNYTVHAFMYLFYGLVALGIKPTSFSRHVTTLQIAQMVAGTAMSLYTLARLPDCRTSWENAAGSVVMYVSYLVLFVNFYVRTYCYTKHKVE